MALKIDFSYSQTSDLKSLEIYDTTGIYNPTTNVGGWGAPNPEIADATSDFIKIQFVGDSVSYQMEMHPTLPNVINQPWIVNNTNLGLSPTQKINDGQYQITRTTVADGITYVRTRRVFLIGQVKCCADQLLDMEKPGCSCNNGRLTDASILQYTLFTLRKAFLSQKFERANQILRYAQSLCESKNCKTC